GRIVYRDRSALGDIQGGAAGSPSPSPPRYLYAVQVVDGRGQRSALSAPQEIQLAVPSAPPAHLIVQTAEGEVRLAWASGARSASSGPSAKSTRRRPPTPTRPPRGACGIIMR